jgi:hypothetical protein
MPGARRDHPHSPAPGNGRGPAQIAVKRLAGIGDRDDLMTVQQAGTGCLSIDDDLTHSSFFPGARP